MRPTFYNTLFVALLSSTPQGISIDHIHGLRGTDGAFIEVGAAAWPVRRQSFSSINLTQSISVLASASDPSPMFPTMDRMWKVRDSLLANLKNIALNYWMLLMLSSLIWTMLVILVAYMYRATESYFPELGPLPKDPGTTRRQLSKWHVTWYQCASDPEVCFWACCCPWIRWAHTMDLLHLMEYGPAFAIFFMLAMVNQITGFLCIGAYFSMILVYYRQKIREVFGMQNYGTFAGILGDWLCLCFCMPCTIAQEAQHVKFAAEQGYPLPACMAEHAGQRKGQYGHGAKHPIAVEEELGTSSSQSFQDVMSRVSGSCRDSPAIPQSEPHAMVFNGLFQHSSSRSSSRGMGFRSALASFSGSRRRSRSTSRDRRQAARSSPTPKPKALTHARSSSSSSMAPRAAWHREAQNPMPERLLAPPPVRAGEHVEVSSDKLSFVQVLETLHDDLRAYAFLFVEVGCVGRCGASCRTLHAYIWSDRAFWQFYCGPSVNNRLAQPWACPAHALREAFRRWIFHIDGVWTKDFREFADQARQSPSGADLSLMLSYARYIASGLMPYDSRPAVADFTSIMCELLAEYNPERAEERNAAEALTAQVECMAEVFTGAQIKMVLSTFDCSLGRAASAPSEAESDLEAAWMVPAGPGEHDIVPAQPPQGEDLEEVVDPPWGDHDVLWFG